MHCDPQLQRASHCYQSTSETSVMSTPSPWTRNTGLHPITLAIGMEVKWTGHPPYRVTSVDPGGATVHRSGSTLLISATSEVLYRFISEIPQIGVDKGTPPVISSHLQTGSQTGDNHMAKASKITASTAARVPIAKKSKPGGGACLCGCGIEVTGYFKRGHVSKFHGDLRRIARGENTPIRILGRSVAGRLGPWSAFGDGMIPSKTYRDLR